MRAAKNGALLGTIIATRIGFVAVLALVAAALFGGLSNIEAASLGLVLLSAALVEHRGAVWRLFGFQRGVMVASRSQLGLPA